MAAATIFHSHDIFGDEFPRFAPNDVGMPKTGAASNELFGHGSSPIDVLSIRNACTHACRRPGAFQL
jgi:hypothetical protein